jgi:hypothetical protein
LCCFLVVPTNEGPVEWSCAACRVEVLEEKHEFPKQEKEKNTFLFPEDNDGRVLTGVLDNHIEKLPLVQVYVFYRNILGACFRLRRAYRLYPKEDTRSTLKTWLERLHNFPIRHKEDLDALARISDKTDPRAEEMFKHLKVKCQEGLLEEQIDFEPWPIPATGEVSNITNEEYTKAVRGIGYGLKMGSGYKCPVPDRQEKKEC